MRILLAAFALLTSIALIGCGVVKPQPREAAFDEPEYSGMDGTGSSTISGQAFLKTLAGDVKYGAGNKVYLNPVTSYSTEWWEKWVLAQRPLEAPDPRVAKYSREVIADGEGRFTFANLPAGNYYIACPITWAYVSGTGAYARTTATGGVAHKQVSVKPGESVDLVVTR